MGEGWRITAMVEQGGGGGGKHKLIISSEVE